LENTFQLEPEVKFSAKAVTDIIDEVLPGQLDEEEYDLRASRQVRWLRPLLTDSMDALWFWWVEKRLKMRFSRACS
jgi:hypothetical protein